MSHEAEPPKIEFKISLGKCGKDLAAMMVALRRLGFFILISVVQTGLTKETSDGKEFVRRHGVLVRPQDVGLATMSCGMEDHRSPPPSRRRPPSTGSSSSTLRTRSTMPSRRSRHSS